MFVLVNYTRYKLFLCPSVFVVVAVGLAFSVLVLFSTGNLLRDAAWRDFELEAGQTAQLVEDRFDRFVGAIESIPALYGASNSVERDEFAAFARRTLASNPGLLALGFVPSVAANERAGFEASVAAEGFPGFQIIERSSAGDIERAGQRDRYYPLLFVEPLAGREAFIGFDMGSRPGLGKVLDSAADSGDVSASGRIQLIRGASGVLWVAPIYAGRSVPTSLEGRRAALEGFAAGVAELETLINVDSRHPLELVDQTGSTIFGDGGSVEEAGDRYFVHQFDSGGTSWTIKMRPRSSVGAAGLNRPSPWLLAGAVLALAALLAHYLGNQRLREREVERLVVERTLEYARANVALQKEMAERQRMQEHLIQAQKMDAIGQLTGGIAHDFNNLLMIIDGYARRAEKAVDPGGQAQGALSQVIKAAEKAAKLTRQLLVFSRRQVMEKRVFKVSEALRETEALLERSVGEAYELTFAFDDESLCVQTDPSELTQAVLNLAVNARDAMQGGGRIKIETRARSLTQEDVRDIEGVECGVFVEISVADTGTGISEWDRLHIFEPFYTTKDQGKGTGLGLAMVIGFAQQSGGTVIVDTAPDVGTTMRILLPQAAGGAQQAAAEVDEDCRGRGETVLVVEDDEALLALNSETLRELGYKVLTAEDGFCALEVEEECEGGIDLLLSDVVMPQMGGFELCEIIREKRPGLRTVFVSGYPNRDSAKGTEMPDNCQFLQKPVSPSHLAKAIRQELDSPSVSA